MINPLRYRSVKDQLEFDEIDSPIQCWQCQQERVSTPAFFLCHDCGNTTTARPFCEPCFFDYHTVRKKGKEGHKPHPIVRGDPVIVQTLADGDGTTFAKMHDWVSLDYILATDESDEIIEDTFSTKRPLVFQSGCSGPCIHLQLLGCTEIAAADILGFSDPYCAIYWKNQLAGVTTTRHMTLNPTWANQTFVLPLVGEFTEALHHDISSALFTASALLPNLRIELYDWDRLSKDDFLGQASITDADILSVLRRIRSGEADENVTVSFNLMPKRSRGKLGIRVALRGHKLLVHVMQAENVPKADPCSLSDPFCEVYWNNNKVGKTAYINDTLDPVWDMEIFAIKIDTEGPNSVEQSTLRIECLDWDQFGGNDVLGQIELQGWQIKELAESGSEDGVMSRDEDALLGEADMEKIYAFIQTFQKREITERGLGKLIVGVPQDPSIQNRTNEGKVDDTAPVTGKVSDAAPGTDISSGTRKKNKPEKPKRKRDLKNEAAVPAETVAQVDAESEPGMEEDQQERPCGIKPAVGTISANRDPNDNEDGQADGNDNEGGTENRPGPREVAGKIQASEEQHGDEEGDTAPQTDSNKGGAATEGVNTSVVQDSLNGSSLFGEGGDRKPGGAMTSGDRQHMLLDYAKTRPEVVVGGVAGPTSVAGDQALPEAHRKGSVAVKPKLEAQEVSLGRELEKECEPALAADVEAGVAPVKTAPAEGNEVASTGVRCRDAVVERYRDASVQRVEEDRGILVQYVDDNTTAWVATKHIPRLQIRVTKLAARNVFQRVWDQRNKLFSLRKRMLSIKRGLKVLLEIAMTGSRMQWYQLELTDEQSGENFVCGTVNLRFLHHTRGSVLRGLDVAVSHMSLGEKARIEVRSDYGFGEVYAARKVPPYATMVFVAQVGAIGRHSARWVLIRRSARDAVDDGLFRWRSYLSTIASSYAYTRRLAGLLGSLRKTKQNEESRGPGNEGLQEDGEDELQERVV